ncbi:MAG: type I DNA topoisomerase [Syntrophales bacterium]|nr:type I DNA topoisomerase [Syntrophales bacterium]
MPQSLIIVESPTKVKTIKKYLGPDFDVRASMGHVMDLPKSKLGIDIQNDFEPTYQVIETKKKVIAELKKAAKNAENIYLAPDPDREGEAIAWHIAHEIAAKGKVIRRVLFNDLTENTILEAIRKPLDLDFNKYEAQQTRRILDRLVGYQISPLLWEKVKRGLSAGRVQSVAVRIICDREAEISKFVPEEYWNITASLEGSNPPSFVARLARIDGKRAKVVNESQSAEIVEKLKTAPFVVSKVEKKEMKRSAAPPFTTSKLQQEASRKLSFSAKKTMSVAQKLYEGIELGKEGSVGLITYMRTDSVRIAEEALKEARTYIRQNYDPDYLPAKPRVFKNAGTAQDAHEAIRPSAMAYKPQDVRAHLNNDQFRLYQLIWNRFVASQMNPAVFDQTTIDIAAGACTFRAQGSVMTFPGFTIVYTEGREDNGNGNGDEGEFGRILPALRENEILKLLALKPEQKFTQPPPRFTEATLVRELEENGIGRPSTYATILSTIQDREYVRLEKQRFYPTDLGVLVTDLLVKNFPRELDVAFTASLESMLDRIEEGKVKRLDTLKDFYIPFAAELDKAKTGMRNVKRQETPTDLSCEKCGSPMVIKWGRNGEFLACSNYPACKNTQNFTRDDEGKVMSSEPQKAETDIACEKCGSQMAVKQGRFGTFLGCSGYPECKNIVNVRKDENGAMTPVKEEVSDIACSVCGLPMLVKRGKFGPFLGCSGYPECKNIVKTGKGADGTAQSPAPEMTDTLCDKCGRPMAIKRGRFGRFLGCSGYPECKNIVKIKAGG